MRKVILSIQMSLDGYIEGPNGAMDWFARDEDEQWQDLFELFKTTDTFLLGAGTYPGYSEYWRATLTNPAASANELAYARLADKTQHVVFSKTMGKANWANTKIVRGNIPDEISKLKQLPGGNMVLFGGAAVASRFINYGLIDEYRLVVSPIILGGGKRLLTNSTRQRLKDAETRKFKSGATLLYYKVDRS